MSAEVQVSTAGKTKGVHRGDLQAVGPGASRALCAASFAESLCRDKVASRGQEYERKSRCPPGVKEKVRLMREEGERIALRSRNCRVGVAASTGLST